MASRTTISVGVLLGAVLLAVTGLRLERAPAAALTRVVPTVHEEDLPPTAMEILDLARQMDFTEVRKQLPQVQPTDRQLADLLKPGQRQTAIALGKALFWDRQLGSDGQACASCHFHAGSDTRARGQLNGGGGNGSQPGSLDPTRSGGLGGPSYVLKAGDFPFHVVKDPTRTDSELLFDTNDVVGSQGTACLNAGHPRATTGRNAPTVINAVFQFRSFWDGRANNHFNGVNPFGRREHTDPNADPESNPDGTVRPRHQLMRVSTEKNGNTGPPTVTLRTVSLDLPSAALASQAVGPPVNSVEMSCQSWPELGRKMISRIPRPLYAQHVDRRDSVLGEFRHPTDGLRVNYRELIQRVFRDHWWRDPRDPKALKSGEFSLIENNFSMFFGIAVMLYEATLISDQSPFDKHIAALKNKPGGKPLEGLAAFGFSVFMDRGKCVDCHRGPELTASGLESFKADREHREQVELMRMHETQQGETAMYDSGFYNLGVRPTAEDLGIGFSDPFGHPLSFTKQYLPHLKTGQGTVDVFTVDPCGFSIQPCEPIERPDLVRAAVDGSFKTPSLRNVELTGPYMHTGGMSTLRQVVEFYDRGGDFLNAEQAPEIKPLWLNEADKNALVAFLKSLTDERVRCEQAPFDHPSLTISDGYSRNSDGTYRELTRELPAVGKGGRTKLGCLKSFEEELQLSAGKGGKS